jgi:serine/threonine protein phosphatase 1
VTRHLAIGDIHGCYEALRALCRFVGLQDDDVIITLGDYPDRGPNTNAVFDYLIHLDRNHMLVPLRGNHDLLMAAARINEVDYEQWIRMGGDATLRSYSPFEGDEGSLIDIPDEHWDFLTHRLQPYFATESHFFVHANADPDLPFDEQPDYMLYWEQFNDPPRHETGKIMVCGHTPQHTGLPRITENGICLDTWACGDGWLSCLHVESGIIWQANQRGETRQLPA